MMRSAGPLVAGSAAPSGLERSQPQISRGKIGRFIERPPHRCSARRQQGNGGSVTGRRPVRKVLLEKFLAWVRGRYSREAHGKGQLPYRVLSTQYRVLGTP